MSVIRTLAQAQAQGDAPWDRVVIESRDFVVYQDKYPVSQGHLLFVPVKEEWSYLINCWKSAYQWGTDWVNTGYCDAFNVGQNVGIAAGQTIMYPHVHLIPRRIGDVKNPRGGIRNCIPGQGNY